MAFPPVPGANPPYLRHALSVRILHWVNVLAFFVLLMSGLQIFNAHPALYWGDSSYSGRAPVLAMGAKEDAQGEPVGVTTVLGHEFVTTGVLGVSEDGEGEAVERGFPEWATLPGPQWLAMGRRWHLFFAWVLVLNGLAYLAYSLASRHLARDLAPTRTDWRSIGSSIRDHLVFRHPQGEAAARYNVLQKLAYLAVIFLLLPLMMLTGWAMSPTLDTALPGWAAFFGGRQSARTIHFIVAWTLVAFILIHVFEVIVSGFWNNLRSMVTGRYRLNSRTDHELSTRTGPEFLEFEVRPRIAARRNFLARALAGGGALVLGGCDRLSHAPWFTRTLASAERLTQAAQRLVTSRGSLAQEFTEADLSPTFRSNGTSSPEDPAYQALAAGGFADYRLRIIGLVARPVTLSLEELRALPSRTQITRHDCVEGWSAIGKWKGALLGELLDRVLPRPEARYLVFHCADPMDERGTRYYESIDLEAARHPQTLLAYELNGAALPIANGAPIRLRVERQLGYKMAKYVMAIELVASFEHIGRGKGGFWEDRGYEWYAGI